MPAMNVEAPPTNGKGASANKRPALRLWVLATALGVAVFYGLLFWPSDGEISPIDLSRADGKPRFYATAYPKTQLPRNLPLPRRLFLMWSQYQWRHRKRNPATYTFPASPVSPRSIHGMLNQCMEVAGTHYLIAVEIAGGVEFGSTNSLNGAQWVAAFEHAIETSDPVVCWDYARKRNFQDTLLVIREQPGVVKIVPRTKLAEYQKAGLVKAGSR